MHVTAKLGNHCALYMHSWIPPLVSACSNKALRMMQVLQRLPLVMEAMSVPSEDEDLVFLTRLLQVTCISASLKVCNLLLCVCKTRLASKNQEQVHCSGVGALLFCDVERLCWHQFACS